MELYLYIISIQDISQSMQVYYIVEATMQKAVAIAQALAGVDATKEPATIQNSTPQGLTYVAGLSAPPARGRTVPESK